MEFLIWIPLAFLLLRTAVVSYNYITWPVIPSPLQAGDGKVSILIPARNEAENLPTLFSNLMALSLNEYEVIVLNDFSTDGTEVVLQQTEQEWEKLKYLNGRPLPLGWLGKNWACHQLAQIAEGDYLLFLDADIQYIHPDLPAHTLSDLQQKKLALISIFPTQIMPTLGEKSVVPLMHFLLLTLLPLVWIRKLPFPSMAAANGQFMLFNAQEYQKNLWHKQVKSVVVEDIAIMRKIKENGLKGMTYLANKTIMCRMYTSYIGGVQGFSKNLLAGFGDSLLGLLLFLSMSLFMWPFVWFHYTYVLLGIALVLLCWMKFCLYKLAREPFWIHLFLHPLHMGSLLIISINSIRRKISGKNIWKGRNVNLR